MEKLKKLNIKWKILVAVLVLALAVGAVLPFTFGAFGATYGDYTYTTSGSSATITKYNNTSYTGSVSVPSKIGSYTVTAIDDFCFSQAKVTSITLPNTVVSVGDCAFEKCSNLTTVNFGAKFKNYGTNVFSETPKMTSVNVSSSNSYFKSVDGVLYSKNGKILYTYPVAKKATEYVVPNTVESVEHYAFDGADNIKKLTVGTGLKVISDLAFIGASNIETIDILSEATYIGNNAFGNINKLSSINIPDTVTYIGKEAFQDDNALKSLVIPASVTYIGVDAFESVASDFLMYCYSGTAAVTYCETYNIEYTLVDSVLSSLSVTSAPTKTRYCVNQSKDDFVTDGLVISAVYSNGISRTVTGYTLSGFDTQKAGSVAITVSFTDGGVTRATSFAITVGNHEWDEGKAVKEPTCTDDGIYKYGCKNCSAEKTESVKALGHDPVDDVWEEPTCTLSGTKDVVCSRCGTVVEEGVEVPALGHTVDKESATKYKPATCTEDGEMAGVCTRCGETFDDIVKAYGHDYEEQVIKPTCEEKGVTLKVCKRCDDVSGAEFSPALGHNYKDTVKDATCTMDGYTMSICQNCGNTKIKDMVSASGHHFTEYIKNANCTETGFTKCTCRDCGEVYYESFYSAKGHEFEKTVKSATSTESGYTKYTCRVCGTMYYSNITQPSGATSIEASVSSSIEVGKTAAIKTTLTPSGIVDRVYFKSTNTSVLTVTAEGVIKGKTIGSAKVRCYLKNGKYKDLSVSVKTPSTSISNLQSVASGRLKVSWGEVNYADGYVVQYSTSSAFNSSLTTKYISGKANLSAIYKGLSSGKKYYVRVAAYKNVSGKKSLSTWSTVKSIKIK